MTARQGLGDKVRLVFGVQLVAQVFDVTFDRARGDAQLLRALLRREPTCNALQDFSLSLRQGDEIFLLPRKIHHASPYWETIRYSPNRLSYHGLTAI